MLGVPSFIAYIPLVMYLLQTSSTSLITLLPWIGVALIAAGIACIIMGGRAAEKAGVAVWGRHPVVKETIREREVVYIRCRYCGAKVPETEKECPKCGATL
ncbi:MAG: zinc ribbon domain-containing protein [Candidatus Jordarchaeaceae archaeon]